MILLFSILRWEQGASVIALWDTDKMRYVATIVSINQEAKMANIKFEVHALFNEKYSYQTQILFNEKYSNSFWRPVVF